MPSPPNHSITLHLPDDPSLGHFVYFIYADSELLYVGYSKNVLSRLSGYHKPEQKSWWPRITAILAVGYESRIEALRAESEMIIQLQPTHNIAFGAVRL